MVMQTKVTARIFSCILFIFLIFIIVHDGLSSGGGSVTVDFDVYNSTQGKQSHFERTAVPVKQKEFIIRIDRLRIANVDPLRIVIRERHQNGKLGRLVAFSGTGEVTLPVPQENRAYDIFLMNASNQVYYPCLDEKKVKMLKNKRYVRVIRNDFQQAGPDAILKNVFRQINDALNPFGIRYGYLDYSSKYKTGDMAAGYGEMGERVFGVQPWLGTHWRNGFLINIKKLIRQPDYRPRLKIVGLEEAFEVYFGVDDICGRNSNAFLQENGKLVDQGKDVIAYYALISPAI
jgi:hypothetical protein